MSGKFSGYVPPHLTTGSEEEGYVGREFASIVGKAHVWKVANKAGNGGTRGAPDFLVFLPERRLLITWDSKTGREFAAPADPRRLTPEQAAFGRLAQQGFTTAFGWGDRDDVRRWLTEYTVSGVVPQWPIPDLPCLRLPTAKR